MIVVKKSQEKYMVQDEVDKHVVIKNVQQDILPSIPIQNGTDIAIKEVDLLKKLNPNSASEDDNSVSSGQSGSVESEKTMNKESASNLYAKSFTPDIVPKSFQDKRYTYLTTISVIIFSSFNRKFFENLGPIKVKNKIKEEKEKISSEEKIGFWLPATPPSQREEDIFIGKKFSKPPKQVKFRDDVKQ